MRFRVDCVKRRSHVDPHERIEGLGGYYPIRWYEHENSIISEIENKNNTYYTVVALHEIAVVVAQHNKRKYLKTARDNEQPNYLLTLNNCI